MVIDASACYAGLQSSNEHQRATALAELRVFLRRALGRSFAGKLNDVDLDDVTQDSLFRIHAQLASFEQQSRFTTWAASIAMNCALSELRRRRHQHVSIDDAAAQGHSALAAEAQTSHGQTEVEIERLRRGIAEALTERQREATLARLSGLPLMEIARRLGTTQGAVYKVLHDARMSLKVYLEAAAQQEDFPASAGVP